jgi:hypothetical protein
MFPPRIAPAQRVEDAEGAAEPVSYVRGQLNRRTADNGHLPPLSSFVPCSWNYGVGLPCRWSLGSAREMSRRSTKRWVLPWPHDRPRLGERIGVAKFWGRADQRLRQNHRAVREPRPTKLGLRLLAGGELFEFAA